MHKISIIVDAEAFPAETVRIQPLDRGRVALFVKSPVTFRRGESCKIRTSAGAEVECVVSEIFREGDQSVTELRCIPEVVF